MSVETDFEQYRIDQNPPSHLRRFVRETARTREIVLTAFRSVRPDADQVRPPVVIYSDELLDQLVTPTLGIKIEGPAKYAYQPIRDEIHISASGATEHPLEHIRMFLAEELIHAQTTRVIKDKTRVAYLTVPQARSTRALSPGAIYDMSSTAIEGGDDTSQPWKGQESTVRLLERTTLLAVHHLLDSLLGRRLPVLLLLRDGKPELVIKKNSSLMTQVLTSMYRDDPGMIPGRILSVLQDPRPILWVSASASGGPQQQSVMMRL